MIQYTQKLGARTLASLDLVSAAGVETGEGEGAQLLFGVDAAGDGSGTTTGEGAWAGAALLEVNDLVGCADAGVVGVGAAESGVAGAALTFRLEAEAEGRELAVTAAPSARLMSLRVGSLPLKNSAADTEGSIDGAGGKMSDWNESAWNTKQNRVSTIKGG